MQPSNEQGPSTVPEESGLSEQLPLAGYKQKCATWSMRGSLYPAIVGMDVRERSRCASPAKCT